MTSRRDSGQFLRTYDSTANWHFEFQDGKMDGRTGKEAGFAGFGSKYGKTKVFWHGQLCCLGVSVDVAESKPNNYEAAQNI